ncbi:histidine phosphatase family protein [Paenibacillus sp. PL91]|uniref:histidine phosphatase family protein n=1 Tax=Paenibacillus sp. PL91 TaxID=2729538 RepID=UPI00145CFF83|nr:histidine phosphatase family protein [Paenibacillus sp. PL91]MBC9199328.1 histidine phosphatase family protein [Paenibacillus sp. PL91]
MNIYIVRHCKADGQAPNANLTEEGHEQAIRLAEFLYGKNIQCIYSSPFVRAVDTIAPLAQKLQVHLITDDRLSERILCGENHPNWREMLRNTFNDLDLCYEDGESSSTAMDRALSVIRDVKESGLTNVVLVTHGNLMSLMLKYYDSKIGYEEWEALSNPDVYHLKVDGTSSAIIKRIWR